MSAWASVALAVVAVVGAVLAIAAAIKTELDIRREEAARGQDPARLRSGRSARPGAGSPSSERSECAGPHSGQG